MEVRPWSCAVGFVATALSIPSCSSGDDVATSVAAEGGHTASSGGARTTSSGGATGGSAGSAGASDGQAGSTTGGTDSGAGGQDASVGGTGGVVIGGTGGTPSSGGTSSSGGRPETDAQVDGAPPTLRCDAGPPPAADAGNRSPSCAALAPTCGPCHNQDCCSSEPVPGGTFYRSYDGIGYTDTSFPATVSAFTLDTYEVTIGRFRNFVAAYSPGMIPEGAGKNPNDPNDAGWTTDWNVFLPVSAAVLMSEVKCDYDAGVPATWTDAPGANENRPMPCITWYEAFAFCVWDGGRLPTEAEWNYAAAGGNEQRVFPWSKPPDDQTVDCSYANYVGRVEGLQTVPCVPSGSVSGGGRTTPVGSQSPRGDGRWGHADLGGNLFEWNLDVYEDPYPQKSCNDCANLATSTFRVIRGGNHNYAVNSMLSAERYMSQAHLRAWHIGIRCARGK